MDFVNIRKQCFALLRKTTYVQLKAKDMHVPGTLKVFHNQLKRFDLAPSLAICNFTMSSTETNGHQSLRMPNIYGCRKKHYLAIRLSETTGKETTLPQA